MTRATSRVVGRDAELNVIEAFLERLESGPCALVLEGSAGIGKTTLWSAGVQAARDRGHRVLTTRAAQSEARLSYAALGDLLGSVPDTALGAMPDPLRIALDGALMRSGVPGGAPDQHAVSLATGHVLRNLAAESPVVIAVDDAQWLDRPSARVLSFALRRLSDEPIGTLASLRLAADAPGDLLELDRALPLTEHLQVGPLGAEQLARILRERTGTAVPHPVASRLHRVTGGNPLFALEMARAVAADRSGGPRGDVWSVPEDLQKLLSARLAAAVPPAARIPLLAIAASTQPTWDLVVDVAGSDERAMAALGRAEEAGIVERAEGRVRFSHPLLGSTLYLNAPAAERRQLHTRLAELTADQEEQARHLALAAVGPDPGVADALEGAAAHARARGAPDAAADLAGLAWELTPPADSTAVRRRRLASAEYLFDGGDAVGAQHVLRETIASSPAGLERAWMQYRLASMSWMNLLDGVRKPSDAALADAGDDPALRSALDTTLAWVAFYRADLPEALARAREAAQWATDAVSPAVRADAFGTLALMGFLDGETDEALWTRALRLQTDTMATTSWTEGSVYTPPGTMLGLKLMWSFRLDEAREVLERELAEYERHAMYILREEAICYLSELESRAGNGLRAAELGAEAMSILEESGQTRTQSHVVLYNQSWAAALLGQVDDARRMATDGVRLAEANDDPYTAAYNRFVLGFLDLSLADHAGACHHLELATVFVDELGAAEPGVVPSVPDLVESYVALGRIADAEKRLDGLESRSGAAGGGWALASAARGRSLVAAARGDLAGAEEAAERSIALFEALGLAFDVARSRLVLGQTHRRAKRKRVAREELELARDTFARLGATLWVERASNELARIGGRPSSPFELTDTEQQIAALVAQGRTNQETADALFVSPSTVRSSLKRVYQKLGVRSRTELAARVGRSPEG